jgi:hypothetical protein
VRYRESRFAGSAQLAVGRRPIATVAALVLLLAVVSCLAASSASAQYIHNEVTAEFGPDGTAGTTFISPDVMAYQNPNKKIYVLDQTSNPSAPKLYGFENPSTGTDTPLGGSFPISVERGFGIPGLAVDNTALSSSNFIYYARDQFLKTVYGFDPTGAPLAGFPLNESGESRESCGDAVDNAGFLWVTDSNHTAIQKYESNGTGPVQTVSAAGGEGICYLAIDQTNNDIYFAGFNGGVYRLTASSGYTTLTKMVSVPPQITAIAVNGAKHSLYVAHLNEINVYDTVTDTQKEKITLGATYEGLAVTEPGDTLFVSSPSSKRVKEIPGVEAPVVTTGAASSITRTTATVAGHVDLDGGPNVTECKVQYGTSATPYSSSAPCIPAASGGTPYTGPTDITANLSGLSPQTTYHYRVVANNGNGNGFGTDQTFQSSSFVTLKTEPASEIGPTSATLNGTVSPEGFSTTYYFEYGKTSAYGLVTSAPLPVEPSTGDVPESAQITELEEGQQYHYRIVGVNELGKTVGNDETFTTTKRPSIEGFSSENLTEDSADLTAQINPNLAETTYYFEYGKTTDYESVAPVPVGVLPAVNTPEKRVVHIEGLEGVTYHFRLIAENAAGVSVTEDQTFDFNPPRGCPNHTLRQQTGAAYLPDCRAYELVSAAQAGGAPLLAAGPPSPYASNPGRFAYVALFNAIPGTGEPINGSFEGDMYVASRTALGWVTRYVGVPGSQSLGSSGPPGGEYGGNELGWKGEPIDASMDHILVWDRAQGGILGGPLSGTYAPDVYDNEGHFLGRLPTNLAEVPESLKDMTQGGFQGSVRITPDFSHYAFSAINTAFASEGLTEPPGSAYDDEIDSNTVNLISRRQAGEDIPRDPTSGVEEEFIRIPAVSNDGSHILMTTAASGGTVHLYMMVDDHLFYEPSLDQAAVNQGVKFEGMSSDGTKVFFTTNKQMTPDDTDTSIDLYMWNQETESLTRISDSGSGPGNTDACTPANNWTQKCNVVVVPVPPVESLDNHMAGNTGEVYFYSPEQLDGARGVPNKRNLYVYRDGDVKHVATLEPNQQITRINVAPNGSHAAFITGSKLTSYENAGFEEMYTYDPATRVIKCVSCNPNGSSPTSNVKGSQDGRFMTDDGRAFFSTEEALVPADANGITDVYEFVEGRPQLISTGTGDITGNEFQPAGLVGVSADGVDAFIGTYETLVGQDENGAQLKFYDARTNGGFPFEKPPAPCEAADECHGAETNAPPPLQIGTTPRLGAGGNLHPKKKKKCKKGQKPSGNKCVAKKPKHKKSKRGGGQRG